MLDFIDYAEYDKDIILPQITDSVEKDFSNSDLENITFSYLRKEFEKFKNYKFKNNIKIESFSI
jgi:inorganic pyrophosphatase